jgi:MSHA biogenesis protein MshL
VLIKPTIIRSSAEWEQQSMRSRGAVDDMDATRARLIQLDGTGTPK